MTGRAELEMMVVQRAQDSLKAAAASLHLLQQLIDSGHLEASTSERAYIRNVQTAILTKVE